jgi:hypothetical protein
MPKASLWDKLERVLNIKKLKVNSQNSNNFGNNRFFFTLILGILIVNYFNRVTK